MDRDTVKLQGISRDLSQLGLDISNREDPPDQEFYERIGSAFVALSEVVADISAALERGALTTKSHKQSLLDAETNSVADETSLTR